MAMCALFWARKKKRMARCFAAIVTKIHTTNGEDSKNSQDHTQRHQIKPRDSCPPQKKRNNRMTKNGVSRPPITFKYRPSITMKQAITAHRQT